MMLKKQVYWMNNTTFKRGNCFLIKSIYFFHFSPLLTLLSGNKISMFKNDRPSITTLQQQVKIQTEILYVMSKLFRQRQRQLSSCFFVLT